LKKYDGLKDLDLLGWHRQISIRNWIDYVLFTDLDEEREILYKHESPQAWAEKHNHPVLKWIERIKCNPIIESDDEHEGFELQKSCLKYPFDTYSVTSTPAYFMHYLGADELLSDVWKCCDILNEEMEVTPKQFELMETPYDLLLKNRGNKLGYACIVETENYAHLTVDLTATDEQIKEDFSHWLTEYKKAIGYKPTKINFTKDHLSKWVEQRLLPCFDLMLISKIEGKYITQEKLTEIILKDDTEGGNEGKLRKTRMKNAEWLMQKETLFAIETQLNSLPPKG